MCGIDLLADSVPPSAVAIPPPPASEDRGVPQNFVEKLDHLSEWEITDRQRKLPPSTMSWPPVLTPQSPLPVWKAYCG